LSLLEQQRNKEDFSEGSFLEGWAHMTGLLWNSVKKHIE
jgi:hypothetical protein